MHGRYLVDQWPFLVWGPGTRLFEVLYKVISSSYKAVTSIALELIRLSLTVKTEERQRGCTWMNAKQFPFWHRSINLVVYDLKAHARKIANSGELTSFQHYKVILHCKSDYYVNKWQVRTWLHFASGWSMQFEPQYITTASFLGGVARVWSISSWTARPSFLNWVGLSCFPLDIMCGVR